MNQTNLLIVVVCEKIIEKAGWREEFQIKYAEAVPKDIHVTDIICVNPTQIGLVNETVGSRQISDVLVACEYQAMELGDLDKLLEILYSCERHGAVVSLNKHSQGICQLTREQYKEVSKYLSDYKVIPQIESFPTLIKAEMFERFGMLDESFNSLAGALADFSLRFNQYGWSTVRANCWCDSGAWFKTFFESDKIFIQNRYPYIPQIEEMYYLREEKAVEHFTHVLIQTDSQKPSLLFSLYAVPPAYNGTANYALKLLAAFWDAYHEKYEISILVKKITDEFHGLSEKYPRVYYPETVMRHTFRLGHIVSQVFSAEHMDIINKCCLKYSICMLDIICLRSHYLCKNDIDRFDLFRDSIEHADLMLSISQFSHDDIVSFFHEEVRGRHIRTGFAYLGTDKEASDVKPGKVNGPFKEGDYFLIIGNPYKHKMIEPVLEILKDIDKNFIVIGTKTEGYYHKSKRIYGYVSGWIDGDRLDGLIAGSKCIIFPSVYEGFGLTLYDAVVYRKKIIVSDTQVNLELKQQLDEGAKQIITYRQLDELKTVLLEEVFENSRDKKAAKVRNWRDVAEDLETWIESMQEEETDIMRLERRWKYLKRYHIECNDFIAKKKSEKRERLIKRCISLFPRTYKIYRRFVTAIDKEHYGNS